MNTVTNPPFAGSKSADEFTGHAGGSTGRRSQVHIRAITKAQPAPAQSIEIILDVINQLIATIRALENLLGFDVSEMLGKEA